jgi:hypothetical protein
LVCWGKFTGNPWVFTIKYRAYTSKFSHPILGKDLGKKIWKKTHRNTGVVWGLKEMMFESKGIKRTGIPGEPRLLDIWI